MNKQARHWVVVPAAGAGRRMTSHKPKQYLLLKGLPVLSHSLQRMHSGVNPEAIVVSIRSGDPDWPQIAKPTCRIITTEGGYERCDSVLNGLNQLEELAAEDDWVWVHDAARPCVRVDDLVQLKKSIDDSDVGGLLALRLTDTVKQADEHQFSVATLERNSLWRALTPQVFRYKVLLEALTRALRAGYKLTDEAQAIEMLGYRPRLVEAHADNIKITRQQDLDLAEFYLAGQAHEQEQTA